MSKWDKHSPDDFDKVVEELRAGRPEPTPLELDRIKTTAMARAAKPTRPGQKGVAVRRGALRRTFVTALVTMIVMAGASGAVLAGTSSTTTKKSAAKSVYACPPNTHGSHCTPNRGSHNSGGSHGSYSSYSPSGKTSSNSNNQQH
jgi:hypothetical protein